MRVRVFVPMFIGILLAGLIFFVPGLYLYINGTPEFLSALPEIAVYFISLFASIFGGIITGLAVIGLLILIIITIVSGIKEKKTIKEQQGE